MWPEMMDDSAPTHERRKLAKTYKNVLLRKWTVVPKVCGETYLKGYTTPKSRSCFCLHFRPKDDDVVVVSILVQERSHLGSKMLRCLYVSVGETPLFGSRE